jgi:serine/threonine protein kinase/tetratricopeptide (TPR) repeat protein
MFQCPSLEQLQLLVDDQLSDVEERTLTAHVDTCVTCQQWLEQLTSDANLPGGEPWECPDPVAATVLVERWLQSPPPAPAEGNGEGALSTMESWPQVKGYAILGELGRGGMGVVYKARQLGLNRLVALKMILEGAHAGAEQLGRFRREAEAVARLQHPHIVQIHEIGEQDGRPFFSMEFVVGGSLADHLDGTPLNPRAAAALVETLARAVHAAHEQGIIHRDLKPANVLLQIAECRVQTDQITAQPSPQSAAFHLQSAIPKISDFGLAKQLPNATVPTTETRHAEQTPSGAILGSPSYMAPEQAQARPATVGRAADGYSLGAILYELLTGRPPFRAETALDTILQVLHEEPVPPRRLQPKLPRDLETICLSCLRKEPQRRYASALALAEDLHCFLAGEPIRARPTGVVERGLKWARRRPTLAALLAVSVAACVVLVIEDQRYKAQLVQSLQQENAQRQRADGNLQLAREAVDKTITKVTGDLRLKQADFHQLRHDLLQYMVPFYEEFVKQQANDRELAADQGQAYSQLAFVRQEMGEKKRAVQEYERMRAIFSQLAADFPTVPEYRRGLARSETNLGVLLKDMGRLREAEAACSHAVNLQKELAEEFSAVAEYRLELAASYDNLGLLLRYTGRVQDAEEAQRKALAIYRQLVAEFPTAPDYRHELAKSHTNIGGLLLRTGRSNDAEANYREALLINKQLAAEFPNVPAHRESLAVGYYNLGILVQGVGRLQEAEEAYREAIALRKQLAAEFPAVPGYRQELAMSHNYLGNVLKAMGRLEEVEATHRDALTLQKHLMAQFQAVPVYRQELADSYHFLGILLLDTARPKEAEAALREALTLQKQLAEEFPAVPDYRQSLAAIQNTLGSLLRRMARPSEAEAVFRSAFSVQKQLAAEFPTVSDYQNELAGTMVNLAELSRDRKEFSDARDLLESAAPHHQIALKSNPRNPTYRHFFMNNRIALVLTSASLGDPIVAAQVAEQLAALGWDPAADAYNAACALSQCVPVVEKDANLSEAKRRELATSYADRALGMLRQAISKGFKDAAHMKKDTDLNPLRSRADFRKLLAELEAEAATRRPD